MPFLGDWEETTIGEFAPLTYGKSLPVRKRNALGQVPVFGSNGIVGYHDTALTDGPTIIIGRKGTAGAVHYSPIPCWPIDTTFFFTADDADLTKFKYYVLRTLGLDAMNTDSAVPGINRNAVQARELYVPPLPEQRRIAHILGALDDKIELNRRMNATLEQMARALFKSWFIDFDPVRAKMSGRWRRGKSLPGLPAHLYDVFPSRLVPSELGEAPEGWETVRIEDIADVSSGKRPKVRYAEASDLAEIPLWGGNGPMAFVPEPLLDYPVLLTGRVGTLGSVFRITTPCWPSDNTLILKAKAQRVFEFLFFQLKRIDFETLNRGSTQPLLTQTDLKMQFLTLPPSDVLDRFHFHCDTIFNRIDEVEKASHSLAALRDTMLPKLVSGELRITEAST